MKPQGLLDMLEDPLAIKAPVPWLPAALISWYAPGGVALALATSWIALFGSRRPRIRTVWHGSHEPMSRRWMGGDFVVNIPHESCLAKVREIMRHGKLCMKTENELGLTCGMGVAAVAPRLLECAVHLECVSGKLVDAGFDTELCGEVVRVHRGSLVIDPEEIPDLCEIRPLSPC
jgi:flavin reductase (DIM6/NTAB) family NADH-FMN oxidoreductase RutF